MALPIIPLLAFCLLVSLAIYRFIIFPALISPISKVPNAHWSVPFSRLYILRYRSIEDETPLIHAAHQRLGPVVRIAPDEVSVNCVDGGVRNIYAGGYEKGDWYLNIFSNYGVMPMFAMPDHGNHSKRKRMLSNIYAKSTLQNSQALMAITNVLVDQRLTSRLDAVAAENKPVEFYNLFCAITHDFVSAYIFGLRNGSDFMQQPQMGQKFFRDYKARQRYQFWPQDLPRLVSFLRSIGLKWLVVPKWVDRANADIESWVLSMCDGAEQTLNNLGKDAEKSRQEDYPTVYAQLRNAILKETSAKSDLDLSIKDLVRRQRLTVASEMLDHTLAGFDTSSITLTFLAWELSRPENKEWQEKLRNEIGAMENRHDAKAVDNLPFLQAILMETLRLHAAIPGNQPRITPPSASLGASDHAITLPPNVRVQSQAWSLHRNPDVFPDPENWDPARWLEASYISSEAYHERIKEMNKWFWAFGSGGRMCVGSNLAMYDMKAIMVAIWGGFKTEVVHGDGMVHRGGYVAEPIGDREGRFCVLSVERVDAKA